MEERKREWKRSRDWLMAGLRQGPQFAHQSCAEHRAPSSLQHCSSTEVRHLHLARSSKQGLGCGLVARGSGANTGKDWRRRKEARGIGKPYCIVRDMNSLVFRTRICTVLIYSVPYLPPSRISVPSAIPSFLLGTLWEKELQGGTDSIRRARIFKVMLSDESISGPICSSQ